MTGVLARVLSTRRAVAAPRRCAPSSRSCRPTATSISSSAKRRSRRSRRGPPSARTSSGGSARCVCVSRRLIGRGGWARVGTTRRDDARSIEASRQGKRSWAASRCGARARVSNERGLLPRGSEKRLNRLVRPPPFTNPTGGDRARARLARRGAARAARRGRGRQGPPETVSSRRTPVARRAQGAGRKAPGAERGPSGAPTADTRRWIGAHQLCAGPTSPRPPRPTVRAACTRERSCRAKADERLRHPAVTPQRTSHCVS